MNVLISPGPLAGQLHIPPSKSHGHRLLIASYLAGAPEAVSVGLPSEDLAATKEALTALCDAAAPRSADCRESGSTLRFLLPVAAVIGGGQKVRFLRRGRLPARPLSPLREEMERHGVKFCEEADGTLITEGTLSGGDFVLDGSVSSQFLTGLLFALPLTEEGGLITVTGAFTSRPYVDLTLSVLRAFGIDVREEAPERADGFLPVEGADIDVCARFVVPGGQKYTLPEGADAAHPLVPEGDWSNGAFFLVANALGSDITVTGLNAASAQGDKIITDLIAACALHEAAPSRKADTARRIALSQGLLSAFGRLPDELTVDATDFPDLVPILAVLAWGTGTRMNVIGAGRLRLKESDRLATVKEMLEALSCPVEITSDGLYIAPASAALLTHAEAAVSASAVPIRMDGAGDHRIVMAAAVAATIADRPVLIEGAEAVRKSYPSFFDDFADLGGDITIEES